MTRATCGAGLLAMLCWQTAAIGQTQSGVAVQVSSAIADRWVAADSGIDLVVAGAPSGRLAVLIGDVDWTALFETTPEGLRYRAGSVRLPEGEHPLVVYLAEPARWIELGRLTLRVLTRGGFEHSEAKPTVDLTNKGQLGIGRLPATPDQPRDTFQDLTMSLGIGTSVLRNGWTTTTQANVTGVSNRPEALRFGEKQAKAPRFDLAGYLVTTGNSRVKLSLGHVTFGGHRQLFNNFASRGALAFFKIGTRADLTLAALNGSAIVGWDNPTGLSSTDHRITGVTFGVELARRAGATRVEASVLDARILPRTGFNQGAVVDAEENRGLGLRVTATDPKQRLRLDGGFARTTFGNPSDPLLSGGAPVVAVRDTTRSARYLDVAYALVQKPKLSLSASARHEMVEPLFGSLQSFVRPDVLQNVAEINGSLAGVSVQASTTWSHDNLDGLPSILKTFTRAHVVNTALPLGTLVKGAAGWLPAVTYTLARTHQFGDSLPGNSDFQASHVPDQVSTNQSVGAEWQQARWHAGYRFNRSFQDNRQVGRTLSDLANLTNNVSFGMAPNPMIDASVEVGFEGADNRESKRIDATRRISLNTTWRPAGGTSVTALLSRTALHNDADAGRSHNLDVSLQFAQTIKLVRTPAKPSAQLFVRYARVSAWLLAPGTSAAALKRIWTINSGVTLSVF